MALGHTCQQTVHAALELTESISDSSDSKQHCAGVFIDLKKAFDTVDHKLLVEKLSFYGQSITFEASDRSRSLPLALIHILASELSLAPIREIAR